MSEYKGRQAQAPLDPQRNAEDLDGVEFALRAQELFEAFWNQEEADKVMPVTRLTREEAIAAGYNVSDNYE